MNSAAERSDSAPYPVRVSRPLDEDERLIQEAVRVGASEALKAGMASVALQWRQVDGVQATWPVVALAPSVSHAPAVFWWLSTHAHERRDDMIVAELAVGDFEAGIICKYGAPDVQRLAASAGELARAFVEGHVTYEARQAVVDDYEGPVASQALTVCIRWSFRSEGGSGGAVVTGYLEDPDALAKATGVRIGVGGEHPFTAFIEA